MSVFLMTGDEREYLDSFRPAMNGTQPKRTMQNDPGENLQSGMRPAEGYELPDPAVGGTFGSGVRNGYSTGFVGRRQKIQPFSGAVAKLPANVANPVQGNVGRNQKHGSTLAAGVRDQSTNYTGSLRSFAETYVGKITPIGSGAEAAT